MPRPNAFDELGVPPGASQEEIERAYRRRVVERHRKGVWRIVDQLRRAQLALRALSDPTQRKSERREVERLARVHEEDHATRQGRSLELLRSYKQRMNRDLERIGAENQQRHRMDLAALEREIEAAERRAATLARRRQIVSVATRALLFALALAAFVVIYER